MLTDEHSHLIKSTEQLRPEKSDLRGDILKTNVTIDRELCQDFILERPLGDLRAWLLKVLRLLSIFFLMNLQQVNPACTGDILVSTRGSV